MIAAIVTIPPYAPFIDEVVKHPRVSGLRLNTVMPVKEPFEEVIARLKERAGDKDLWIDLKGRQLRVKTFGVPPFTEIELTHNITVETPVAAYFNDGREKATVLTVDGNRLIMQEGPRRVIGPGESVNIPHPSLSIHGYFTNTDKDYISAAVKNNVHTYMLSFFEEKNDLAGLFELDAQAIPVLKIESQRGLQQIKTKEIKHRLMTARGDLYLEVQKPHYIIRAMEEILNVDATAIAASRIFPSFAQSYEPECRDIGDVDNLIRMGYRTFMLGDEVCMRREAVLSSLNLLSAIAEYHERKVK